MGGRQVPSFLYDDKKSAGSLTSLNLSHNELGSLPEALSCLKSLQCISLEHNKLMRLPAAMAGFHQLVALQCASNLLCGTLFGPEMGFPGPEAVAKGLPALVSIDASCNRLTGP